MTTRLLYTINVSCATPTRLKYDRGDTTSLTRECGSGEPMYIRDAGGRVVTTRAVTIRTPASLTDLSGQKSGRYNPDDRITALQLLDIACPYQAQ